MSFKNKLAIISALNNNLETKNFVSRTFNINTEELGGDYWVSKGTTISAARAGRATSFNGFIYNYIGKTSSPTNIVHKYNDLTDAWISVANGPYALSHNNLFSINGYMYTQNGSGSSNHYSINHSYNDVLNVWTAKTDTGLARRGCAYFVLGYAYVSIGRQGTTDLTVNLRYDDILDSWIAKAQESTSRFEGTSSQNNSCGYSIGGFEGVASSHSSLVNEYTEELDSWVSIDGLNTIKYLNGAFSINGFMYEHGGYNGGSNLIENYVYNKDISVWTAKKEKINQLRSNSCADLNGYGYSINGYTSSNQNAVEQYRNTNNILIQNLKTSRTVPKQVFVGTNINGVNSNLPIQLRTDGANWRYMISNENSILKQGEVFSGHPSVVYTASTVTKTGATDTAFTSGQRTSNAVLATKFVTGSDVTTAQIVWETGGDSTGHALMIENGLLKVFAANVGTEFFSHPVTANTTYATASVFSLTNDIFDFYITDEDRPAIVTDTKYTNNSFTNGSWSGSNATGIGQTNGTNRSTTTNAFLGSFPVLELYYWASDDITVSYTTSSGPILSTNSEGLYSYDLKVGIPKFHTQGYWVSKKDMSTDRKGAEGQNLNDLGYVSGGINIASVHLNVVEEYDKYIDDWATKEPLPSVRSHPGSFILEGFMYVHGGYNGSYLNANYQYDQETNSWTQNSNVSYSVRQGAQFTLNGYAYACCGQNSSTIIPNVYRYTRYTDTWTAMTSNTYELRGLNGITLDSFGHLFNGKQNSNSHSTHNTQYNDATNTWAVKTSSPTSVFMASATTLNSLGFSSRGSNGAPPFQVETRSYNPTSDYWKVESDGLFDRDQASCLSIDNKMSVVGGRRNNGSDYETQTHEQYHSSINISEMTVSLYTEE